MSTPNTPPPRCSSCYRPAPFHTKQCQYAAAASLHPDAPPPSPYNQSSSSTSLTPTSSTSADPPAYSQHQGGQAPPNVVYEQRRRAHGPITYAIRWGMEKAKTSHDRKAWEKEGKGVPAGGDGEGGGDGVVASQVRSQESGVVRDEEGGMGDEKRG